MADVLITRVKPSLEIALPPDAPESIRVLAIALQENYRQLAMAVNNLSQTKVPAGGTSSQVLAKSSNADFALTWANQSGGGGTWPGFNDGEGDPAAIGTVADGTSTYPSRRDHVHAGDHTALSNKGTNTHAQLDTFVSSKAAASGLASLDGSSKVVQDPANATATPAGSKIPIAGGGGVLAAGWIPDLSGTYAPTAKGVTNGDSHDHNGGDGAQIAHGNLSGIGTNAHSVIDTHLAAAAPHSGHVQLAGQLGGSAATPDVRGLRETNGPTLLTMGSVTDGQLFSRSGSNIVGVTPGGAWPGFNDAEGDPAPIGTGGDGTSAYPSRRDHVHAGDHVNLANKGTQTHAQIDTHLGSTSNPHSTSDANLVTTDVTTGNVTSTKHGFAPKSPGSATQFLNGAATPVFATPDHTAISNIGTNSHATIDTHLAADAPHSGHVQVGGQIGGTAASPDVRGLRETTGPTLLTIGSLVDGEFLKRSGTTLISGMPSGSWPGFNDAEGDPAPIGTAADGTSTYPARRDHIHAATEASITTTDVTTGNVTSTKHGFAPKSPAVATQYLNGAATPAFATPDHTAISNIGTNSHATLDTFVASKAAASGLASLDASSIVVQAIRRVIANTTALTTTEGYLRWDSTRKIWVVYDAQRERGISPIGWMPFAYPPWGGALVQVTTAGTVSIAANGGCASIPIILTAPMLLQSVTFLMGATAGISTGTWGLYEQYLNNGNAGENTLTRVAYASATTSLAVSGTPIVKTLASATSAPVFLPPGLYWLVLLNAHATNAFTLATSDGNLMAANHFQTKNIGVTTAPATLDHVAATWAKQTTVVSARLDGRVFGQTAAF